jgi:hypothetical protein
VDGFLFVPVPPMPQPNHQMRRWTNQWWLFLQRFCYRQVMYYVMIKSVAMALRGPIVGWGKLERKATAEAGP